MKSRATYERPAPGNPQNITINQHIRSKSCIKRFAGVDGLVGVLERGRSKPYPIGPAAECFCALRAWDQRLEHSKWTVDIETAFVDQARAIVSGKTVTNHEVVTDYFALWQVRAQLAALPLEDAELCIYPGRRLTHQEEDLLERKHVIFVRPSATPDRVVIPGRLMSFQRAVDDHRQMVENLHGARWGVLRATDDARFLCPDVPGDRLYMPLTPRLALAVGHPDYEVGRETVEEANRMVHGYASRLVFGRLKDVERFHTMLERSPAPGRRSPPATPPRTTRR